MNSKPWYQSKGVTGGIVSGIALLAFAAKIFGVNIDDLVGPLGTGLTAVVGLIGTIVAIYGRFQAPKAPQLTTGAGSPIGGAIIVAAILFLSLGTVCAGPIDVNQPLGPTAQADVAPTPIPSSAQDWLAFAQGVSNSKDLTVGFAPIYSSSLATRWGLMGEAGYPVNPFLSVNVRGYFINNNYYEAAGGAQVKADVQMFGHNFTPYAVVDAIKDIGDNTHPVGALIGTGFRTNLISKTLVKGPKGDTTVTLSLMGEVDYISYLPGVKNYLAGARLEFQFP